MEKWFERIAMALVVVFTVMALAAVGVTWNDCADSGGVAVRGQWGMECIK